MSGRKRRAKALCAAFDKLDFTTKESLLFDAIYIDESQDLIPAEFEFLLRLARKEKDGKQTFILFYDNAQKHLRSHAANLGQTGH